MKRLFVIPLATILFCCCNNANSEKIPQQSETEQQQTIPVPDGWTTYRIGDSFGISIPPTMELRDTSSLTGKLLNESKNLVHTLVMGHSSTRNSIVFQQKGLNNPTNEEAFDKHCRIIIHSKIGQDGQYAKATDYFSLSEEDIQGLKQSLHNQLPDVMKETMGNEEFSVIRIGDIVALLNTYTIKEIFEHPVTKINSYFYYLQNYNEMAEITISFRENEGWDGDMQQVINTFRWLKIK